MELKKFHLINLQSLGLLIVFLLGIGAAIFGMKLNWLMSDRDIKWYTGITVCANFLQFFIPVIIRLVCDNIFSRFFHAYNAYELLRRIVSIFFTGLSEHGQR